MDNIKEAYRYLNNAKDILSTKAEKQDGFYQDKNMSVWPATQLIWRCWWL